MLRYTAGLILLAFVSVIALAGLSFYIPIHAKKTVERLIKNAGFHSTQLPNGDIGLTTLEYNNINLDSAGLSTLRSLKISYNPLSFILSGQINSLQIEGLNLIGDMDKHSDINITGWNPTTQNTFLNNTFKADTITINNATLSLLNEKHGAISILIDGESATTTNGHSFQGKIISTQKTMRYEANLDGLIKHNRTWDAHAEIIDLRIENPEIKMTRGSGEMTLTNHQENTALNGELRAGNITIKGLPWKTPSITLKGSIDTPGIIIGSKASGTDGVELGLALKNIYEPHNISGYLYAETLSQLFDYLDHNKSLPLDRKKLAPIDALEGIELSFERTEKRLNFTLKSPKNELNFRGYAPYKADKNGNIKIVGIAMDNTQAGSISITNPDFFKHIEAGKKEKALIKKALANMTYKRITIAGKINDNYQGKYKVELAGQSPNLESGRPFKLDFILNTDIYQLINALN